MPDLATLQTGFMHAVLHGHVDARLAIYRNTVLSGLHEALRLSYPVTERLVGADFFRQTAIEFARRMPPREPVLARYGAAFPDFLATLPSLGDLPYIADVATLEWAVDQAELSPTVSGSCERRLTLPTEQGLAVVTLAPSLRLVQTKNAVHGIWLSIRTEDEGSLSSLDWRSGPQWLAVHHQDGDISVTALTPACWQLCRDLLEGTDIERAVSTVASGLAAPDDIATVAGDLMGAPFTRVDIQGA